MNYDKLFELLGNHPNCTFTDSLSKKAKNTSFYLFTKSDDGNHVCFYPVILDSIEAFKKHLPVLFFSYEAFRYEDDDFSEAIEDIDYQEAYDYYQKALNENWQNENDCNRFLDQLAKSEIGQYAIIKGIVFGKVTELLNATEEEFDECKKFVSNTFKIKKDQVKLAILNSYWKEYGVHPSENEEQFLNFFTELFWS